MVEEVRVVEEAARVDAVVEDVPIRPRFRAVGRGASDLNSSVDVLGEVVEGSSDGGEFGAGR